MGLCLLGRLLSEDGQRECTSSWPWVIGVVSICCLLVRKVSWSFFSMVYIPPLLSHGSIMTGVGFLLTSRA